MTTEPTANEQQKLQFVDSLLNSLYENDRQHAQSLVTSGLERLNEAPPKNEVKPRLLATRNYLPRWQVIGLVSAALVLAAIFLPFFDASRSAMAAVTQSIQQALKEVGRHYSVTSRIRVGELGTVERRADLFVKGGERLAIHADGALPGPGIWLIGDRGQAWVVPPIGPVIEGNANELIAWLARRDDLATPYLHISTVLERMRESYELESLPESTLQTIQGEVACQHVIGVLRESGNRSIPARIELWADAKSGVAMKVIAHWQLEPEALGRESISIEFLDDIELADEFFTPDDHGGKHRRRISFMSNSNQN